MAHSSLRTPLIGACIALGGALLGSTGFARAATESVLYSFPTDNSGPTNPSGPVLLDAKGELMGTTRAGGDFNGAVYRLSADGILTNLYSFSRPDDGPESGVIMDKTGNLFGTTYGMADSHKRSAGTVFGLRRNGSEVSIGLSSDHSGPSHSQSGLAIGAGGYLFGTSSIGGTANKGTVFEVLPSGKIVTIHSFTGGANDGSEPSVGNLAVDSQNNLYGATTFGGATNDGVLYRITPTGEESILMSFKARGTCYYPNAGLLVDGGGNIYGTTQNSVGGYGCVYRYAANGAFTVLHNFAGAGTYPASSDGIIPNGGLVFDPAGNLYGTTAIGGPFGAGTVFKLDPENTETILYSFSFQDDGGANPSYGVALDRKGNLYGTTIVGGPFNTGVIYRITP